MIQFFKALNSSSLYLPFTKLWADAKLLLTFWKLRTVFYRDTPLSLFFFYVKDLRYFLLPRGSRSFTSFIFESRWFELAVALFFPLSLAQIWVKLITRHLIERNKIWTFPKFIGYHNDKRTSSHGGMGCT